ncbi:unnamed protein product [Pedinophyceae sp. YPF-701]|nr:unnamed protein product [Pedinophyceae sp. YPF-701]
MSHDNDRASNLDALQSRIDSLNSNANDKSLRELGAAIWDDPQFLEKWQGARKRQLTSIQEGKATKDSRIQELAKMVKEHRRAMDDMWQRKERFLELCRAYEDATVSVVEAAAETARRAAQQQAQAPACASTAGTHEMRAEMARLRADLAQAQAEAKQRELVHAAEADRLRADVRRAEREGERMHQEREMAREMQRRAEGARQQAESDIRAMKKDCKDQVRKAEAEREAVQRELDEATRRAAAAEREARAHAESLETRLAAAKERGDALEGRLRELGREMDGLGEEVAGLAAERDGLAARAAELEEALGAAQGEGAAAARRASELEGALATEQERAAEALRALAAAQKTAAETERVLREQLDGVREELGGRVEELESGLSREREESRALRERADIARESATQALEAARAEAADARAEAAALREGAASLDAALACLRGEKEGLEGRASTAEARVAELEGALEGTSAELAGARAALESAEKALGVAQADASEAVGALDGWKGRAVGAEERLERLEAELETLKEVAGCQEDGGDVVSMLIGRVAELEAAAAENEGKRRKLQNEVIELKGNIRVFCRVRPSTARGASTTCLPDGVGIKVRQQGKEHAFAYDRVFGEATSQDAVFAEVSELVQSALDGYKVCLFSYGQTGAGKTHTMLGVPESPSAKGIIPRAVEKILDSAQRMRAQGWAYTFQASFVEIYNEALRDLLAPKGQSKIDNKHQPIKHDTHTIVEGARREEIACFEDALALIARAAETRETSATAMNAVSSRSHSVFMLYITGAHEATGLRLTGALNLVDLAGSERLDKSKAEGARQKEACAINKSLSALGDVFAGLAAKNSHIPYRNSKLTQLLQPCLGGDGKTLMFVNVNPDPESAHETLCSMRFASRVNTCETGARGGAKRSMTTVPAAAGTDDEAPSGTKKRPATAGPSVAAKRTRF